MTFVSRALTLKNYVFYMMFLEFNKMVTEESSRETFSKIFKLFMVELLESIKDVALSIEAAQESNIPEYQEYVIKLTALISKYSLENADGTPVISESGQISIIPELLEEYKEQIKNLIESYKDVLAARQHEVKCINEYMDKEIAVDVPTCDFAIIPETISMEQMRLIKHVIKD